MVQNPLKAIVVEDEEFPRLALIQKLAEYHSDIEIIDQCEDADDALKAVLLHHPDLLFLDIQLPGKDSLWLLEQLKEVTHLPYIIFTTAYDMPEYLLKAIKFAAVDYLLKPVDIVELSQAVKKVRDRIAEKQKQGDKAFRTTETQVFSFRTFNSTLIVKAEDILYVKADGNYSDMYLVSGNQETIFERLGEIEHKLSGTTVVRAGKSHLINKTYIYKIEHKKRICILQIPSAKQYKVEISAKGIEDISL